MASKEADEPPAEGKDAAPAEGKEYNPLKVTILDNPVTTQKQKVACIPPRVPQLPPFAPDVMGGMETVQMPVHEALQGLLRRFENTNRKMKPEAAVQFLAEEICRIKYGRDMMDPRCEREADTAGLTRCVLRRRAEIRERRRSAREDLKRIGQEAIVMVRKAVREEALAFIRRKGGHAKRVAEAKHYLLRRGEHAGKEERALSYLRKVARRAHKKFLKQQAAAAAAAEGGGGGE